MIKKLLAVLILVGLLIGGWSVVNYFRSFKVITLSISKDVASATVYQSGSDNDAPKSLQTFHSTGSLKLRPGSYYVKPEGEKIDTTNVAFTVTDVAVTVPVDPGYSSTYLQTLVHSEQTSLNGIIGSAYPNLIKNYSFTSGKLYGKGEWYAATLLETPEVQSDVSDTYRVILHKENEHWVIVVKPQLVIYDKSYPDIPRSIISQVNQLPFSS